MAKAITVATLMAGKEPNPSYEGWVTNDDMCFAIDIGEAEDENAYSVAQMGIAGFDSQMNPITVQKTYIRAGQSTTKTGTQRTFKMTGDRYVGDPVQDFLLSAAIKYGTGNAVVVPYVYFNILTGKGEKGMVSVIVNSDGSGNAGESAAIDIDFQKIGDNPAEYTYAPA